MTFNPTGRLRLGLLLVTLGLGSTVLLSPEILQPQVMPKGEELYEPCAFEDPDDPEWACEEKPHIFAGECEGIDCYTDMERCCSRPIVVH